MSEFGQIAEPSSRTVWEDWDDVNQETTPNLRLQEKLAIPAEIDSFLILEGTYLYDCVKTQNNGLKHINSVPEVNLHIYKLMTKNIYICAIKDYNLIQSSEIVELLKEFITNSVEVVAVVIKPLVEYQVPQLPTSDIVIRSICTSSKTSKYLKFGFEKLEQPNIVAGVAAGALCLREIIDKPATIIVFYINQIQEQKIVELQEVLARFDIYPNLKKVIKDNVFNSNLYI